MYSTVMNARTVVIIFGLVCSVTSLTTEYVCSGVSCYNGGSFEYSDHHCVCKCHTGYFGLLCEIELVESAWPDGPYALLTARSGCPEAVNRGWTRGFVHLSMATPITIRRTSGSSNHTESDIEDIIYPDRGANIEGPFSSAFIRLNFCFKRKTHIYSSEQIWPDGNYSIFGTEDDCPEGFIEEIFTFNLPAFRSWMKDGYLPYMVIHTTTSEIVVKLCRRTSPTSHYSEILGTFVVLKNSDTGCDAGNGGYDVIEETLEFLSTKDEQTERTANNSISFCHFWNRIQYKLQPCAYDKHHCGRGHCIPLSQLCDGIADCLDGNDENDDVCAQKCSLADFHCGKGVCISSDLLCDFTIDCPDGRDESDEEGHCKKFYGDYFNCLYPTDWLCHEEYCIPATSICDGWQDCADGSDEEAQNCLRDTDLTCSQDELKCYKHKCVQAVMCNSTMHCSLNNDTETDKFCNEEKYFSCGDGACIDAYVYVCDGLNHCADGRDELPENCFKKCRQASLGNYFCHDNGCVSHQAACSELSECGEKYKSLQCLHELGLSDGTIHDFQISASSFQIGHGPPSVRPTLNSWCPTEDDIDPFLQIDFYTQTLVEGLIVYNRMIVRGTIGGNEYLETITPVGCRSFAVSYAMFPEAFKFYMDQPFQIDFALNYIEPQTFRFLKPFLTRFIRVHILSPIQEGDLCLQLEILGCRGKGYLAVDCDKDSDSDWVHFPLIKPTSSPVVLGGIQSLDDCKEVCKSQFDRCTAVDYIQDKWCGIYERGNLESYDDTTAGKTSTTRHLQICLTEEETDFFSTLAGGYYKLIDTKEPGEITSLGYPFLYKSRMVYQWKISSDSRRFVRITFLDISLHQCMTGDHDGCDAITIDNQLWILVINSSYNGRTPTVPTNMKRNAAVIFKTYQRYAEESYHYRGFRFLYQFDHYSCNLRIFPAIVNSASMLGIQSHDEYWIRTQGYTPAVITFIYFNVPCNDDFTFLLNKVAYCNQRWPRQHLKDYDMRFDFGYSGRLSIISPEGFSATISLSSEDHDGPVILTHGGKRITEGRKFFRCHTTDMQIDIKYFCDGVEHCVDGSDEKACEFVTTEPVYNKMDGKPLEGMEICSEELKKCFIYFHFDKRKTWSEERSVCYAGGYSLPSIHKRDEMEFIRKWMQTLHIYRYMPRSEAQDIFNQIFYTYIGLVRYKSASGWDQIWQDGSKVSFTVWGKDEPVDGVVNQCTEMVLGLYSGEMVWRSRPCDEVLPESIPDIHRFFGTLCERQMNTATKGSDSTIIDKNSDSLPGVPMEKTKLHLCSSGEWIYRIAICDGVYDCSDGSDEVVCETRTGEECLDDEFRCTYGECIHLDKVCDHKADCIPDGNDEYCNFPPCEELEFRCLNQRCIPLSSRCDSFMDCEDRSDEVDCSTCNTNTSFLCADMTCIHKSKVCDSYVNCIDGRDERVCEQQFTSCYDLWLSGHRKNATIVVDEGDTIECEFYLKDSWKLMILTIVEIDTTWQPQPMHIQVNTETLWMHGHICTQKIRQSCLESEMYLATFYDPHMNESFSHCKELTTTITITFSDSCENITDGGPDTDGNYPFHAIPDTSCHGYSVRPPNTNWRRIMSVGFVICEAEYQITEEQIGCEDGTVVSIKQRCLYDKARGGHSDGCRNFKHLENCENFKCPVDYVKCPGSFCLERSFLCDGDRQCPGGEDELGCLCETLDTSLAIIYHGTAREDVRPYIFRLARQFYTPNKTLQMINYTVHGQISRYYKLSSRPIHPVLEHLSMVPFSKGEAGDADLAEKVVSMSGNGINIHVIVVEDTVESTLLPPTVFTDNPHIKHVYRVQTTGNMKQHAVRFERYSDNMTLIKVDRWIRLSFNGAGIFSGICKGDLSRNCRGQYRCSSSMICLPLSQVCDGNSQCPFGDDEELCDFNCPDKCSCERYIADCNNANFTDTDVEQISNNARMIDMSNNVLSQSGGFSLSKTFPRLVRLVAYKCEIRFIMDRTFSRAKQLIYLDLSYNKIVLIKNTTFDGLVFLQHLILKGNSEIESIEPRSFFSLQSITRLAITGTKLFEVQPNTFAGLSIDELDLSDNRIVKVHNYAFNDLVAVVVKLDGNDVMEFESDIFAGLRVVGGLETPAFKFCCYRPSSLPENNCYPREDEFSSCEDLMRNSALQTLLWIICVLALVGNLSSITYRTLYDGARLKTGFGMFVTNLAVSDFLMGLYMMIIAIADLTFRKRYITVEDYWRNSIWCIFAGVLATVSSEASVFFLCLITLDRILVIKFPFGQFRFDRNKAVFAVVVSWVFSLAVAVLPVVYTAYFQGSFYSTTGVCLALPLTRRRPPGWLYAFMVFVILNFVAFIMIATGQLLIYLEIRKNSKRMKKVTTTRRKDLTIARNLLLVLTTDFMCWFPVGVMGILATDDYEIPGEVYAWTAVLILPINSALNPFLYTLSAVVSKKTFNPRIDEQMRPAATTDTCKRMLKIWNSGVIIGLDPIGYLNLVDMIKSGVPMTTKDILIATHVVVKCVSYLHTIGHVHGALKETCIYLNPQKAGKVAVRGYPSVVKNNDQQAKDVYDFGLIVRYMLKST